MLENGAAFAAFLDDGRICLTNNCADRAMRGNAIGRKAWLFADFDRGGQRAAFMFSFISTAKRNGVDPQAWLADVLACVAKFFAAALARVACPETGMLPPSSYPSPQNPAFASSASLHRTPAALLTECIQMLQLGLNALTTEGPIALTVLTRDGINQRDFSPTDCAFLR